MVTENKQESVSDFAKASFDFFINIYPKVLVTYLCGLYFLVYSFLLLAEKALEIPIQSKLLFFLVSGVLLTISYAVRYGEFIRRKVFTFFILLGNVFGFLFNIIYLLTGIGDKYQYSLYLGGIEQYVLYVDTKSGLNMIEAMYSVVGGMLCMTVMLFVIFYGLSLKDKVKKEGGSVVKALVPIFGSIIVVFSLFLFVLFHQDYYKYILYLITGSMLFIYTKNIFKKNSSYINLKL